VRVLSVADGLDSEDEEANVGIQVRGIFNELQLTDLRKKTLRGQIGQKQRGFIIEPREATVVLSVFHEFADGHSESRIVRRLNERSVPSRRKTKAWSPATVHRMLRNDKYVGRWIWNRSQTRRDPKTGRRRQFPKPESEGSSARTKPSVSFRRPSGSGCRRGWWTSARPGPEENGVAVSRASRPGTSRNIRPSFSRAG
jgi:hypothetical protein